MHFIAFIWPVLKYLLIVLGLYFAYEAISDGIQLTNWIISSMSLKFISFKTFLIIFSKLLILKNYYKPEILAFNI